MAGVTDVPFRRVAWTCGVGYQMGEMVSDNPRLWNSKKSRLRRMPLYGCGPQVVQIAGSEPEQVAQAAVLQWQTGADVLDINFGCPAKKVCRKAAGSALLANPQLVQDIAAAVVAAVPIPVTAKIRTGPAPGQHHPWYPNRRRPQVGKCRIGSPVPARRSLRSLRRPESS